MDEQFPPLVFKTVTCRTEECANSGVPITLPCGDLIYCGICMSEIDDIVVTTDL